MKRFIYILAAALVLFTSGCGGGQHSDSLLFTETLYTPSYAAGFEILGSAGSESSLLRVTRPWQGEELDTFELLILRGGDKAPSDFRGAVIKGSAQRIVTLSSGNLAMFDRLGEAQRVVGVSGVDYISSPAIVKRAAEGEVHDIGYETALNYELLTLLKPDIILLYSVAGRNSSVTDKLDELSLPYIYIGDYAEESPLGKAEWIVAMGEICGERPLSERIFNQTSTQYNALKARVEKLPHTTPRPTVMLNTPYRDVWYMPSAKSYMVRLIEDAGGDYIYPQNDSQQSQPISIESAYHLSQKADIWINTGATINSLAELRGQIPLFGDVEVVRSAHVYNNTARRTPKGGSDFWESGVVNPDIVLRDLIEIMHPTLLEGDDELYYYQRLQANND